MRYCPVDELKPGMEVAKPVMNAGSVLLDRGIIITEDFVKSLKKRDVFGIYVEEHSSELPEFVQTETVDQCMHQIREFQTSRKEADEFFRIIRRISSFRDEKAVPFLKAILKSSFPGINPAEQYYAVSEAISCILPAAVPEIVADVTEGQYPDSLRGRVFALCSVSLEERQIRILLKAVPGFSFQIIPAVSDLFQKCDYDVVMKECEYFLEKGNDNQRRSVISMLRSLTDPQTVSRLTEKYLGIRINTNSVPLENLKITSSAETAFTEKSRRNLEVFSKEVLKNTDFEQQVNFRENEVRKPALNQDFTLRGIEPGRVRSVLQGFYNESLTKTEEMFHSFRSGRRVMENEIEDIVSKIYFHVREVPAAAFEMLGNNTINNYLLAHSLNVTYVSLMIGQEMRLSEEKLMVLGIASLLHDAGMVKLDRLIWNQPRKLENDEYFDIQKHTVFGIDTLAESTRFPREIAYVAYQHHECIDGSGYPKGRKFNLISEMSQIVSIASVFEAMTSTRKYRRRLPYPQVVLHLMMGSGTKFNPEIVKLLTDYIRREKYPDLMKRIDDLNHSGIKKIMVFDQSPQIREMLTEILNRENFSVLATDCSGEWLSEMEEYQPDLLIMDLFFRKKDGFEICSEIRSLYSVPDIPVIVFSDRSDKNTIFKAKQCGVSGFVVRPGGPSELISRILRVLSLT